MFMKHPTALPKYFKHTIPRKRSNAGKLVIPNFKIYCRGVVIKNNMIAAQERLVEQWKKLKTQT